MASLENTLKLSDVNEKDYAAIFYVGGHGPCFVSLAFRPSQVLR